MKTIQKLQRLAISHFDKIVQDWTILSASTLGNVSNNSLPLSASRIMAALTAFVKLTFIYKASILSNFGQPESKPNPTIVRLSRKKMVKKRQMKISALEEDVLTVLLQQEAYGFKILKILNEGRKVPLCHTSLYSILHSLSKKKLASWRWGEEQEKIVGGRRKYYRLTPLGEAKIREIQKYREDLQWRSQF